MATKRKTTSIGNARREPAAAATLTARHEDFYQRLRSGMRAWLAERGAAHKYADYLMLAPDLFHLLCKLAADPRVPLSSKAKLMAAIAYFVAPTDVVPELLLGPAGYIDDVALAAYLVNELVQVGGAGHRDVLAEHWAGDGDVLALTRRMIDEIDAILSGGAWKALRGLFGSRGR
jgi:uncharacterized membrane protein YkvA (DUF1232 family)